MTTPTPKQRLIEAVYKYQVQARSDMKVCDSRDSIIENESTIADCDYFISLIEEIIPNE